MSAVYSPHVKFLRKWRMRGGGDGEFDWPQGLVIDGGGNVYVSECINDRIQVFDPQGRFLRKWGRGQRRRAVHPSRESHGGIRR